MDDVVDLTGDGGVVKKIITRAKAGALAPSEDLPMVDGMHLWLDMRSLLICYDD